MYLTVSASAQNKAGKDNVQPQENPNLIKDVFKGGILNDGQNINTVLVLKHLLYADDGDFTLDETYKDAKNVEHTENCFGEWTVIKGDAKNENATVVELDAPQRIMYFLRLKNGNLQKLDTGLREIKPVNKYLLAKEGGSTVDGTYTGRHPSPVCNHVETTLTLECGETCNKGKYTLTELFVGTPKGNKVTTKKGNWGFADNNKTVVVLDPDKPGRTLYEIKYDGGLKPMDKDHRKPDSPFDGSLEKK